MKTKQRAIDSFHEAIEVRDEDRVIQNETCIIYIGDKKLDTDEAWEWIQDAIEQKAKREKGCEWCLGEDGKSSYTMFWERGRYGNHQSAMGRMKGKDFYCGHCGRDRRERV